MAVALVAGCVRRAGVVLLCAGLVTAWAAWYTATHISIDTDTSTMLDPDLPHRQASRALDAAFPNLPGDVVVYIEGSQAHEVRAAADALAATLRTRADIARAVYQPGGGEFFARNGLLYLSSEALWDLADRLAAAEPLLATLGADPTLTGLFEALEQALARDLEPTHADELGALLTRVTTSVAAAARGDATAVDWQSELFAARSDDERAFVLITPALTSASFRPAAAAIDGARRLLDELHTRFPGVTFYLTGPEPMDGEELATVDADARLTTVVSFVIVGLILVWGLESAVLVAAVLITLACGLIWTAAFATAAIGSLNIISVCFAVLFIGMGVDFGIQFALRYREELALGGGALGAALAAAAHGVGSALMLAALGAAVSFLAFVPTSYRGLAQLGVISGCSMAIALVANLTILPALLARLPAPRIAPRRAAGEHLFGRFIAARYRLVLTITLATVVLSIALLPKLEFDLNPLNLKDPTTPAVAAFRRLSERDAMATYSGEVLAASLDEARRVADQLSALPEVARVVTLASFVPRDQDEKLEIIDAMRTTSAALFAGVRNAVDPARELAALTRLQATAVGLVPSHALHDAGAELAAALAALARTPGWPAAGLPSLRQALQGNLAPTLARLRNALEAQAITFENLPRELRDRYVAADGHARIEVYPRADLHDNANMREFARALQAHVASASGAPIELVLGADAVVAACMTAALLALVVTIIVHWVTLRGVVDALFIAVPLIVAMLLTVATSVMIGLPLNFANIIALPLLIGLNNAYGAYLVLRRNHTSDVAALLDTTTPRAILFSGLTTIASFGTLALSTHPGMAGMGTLIAMALGYALLCALIVLPACMVARERKDGRA